MKFRKFWVRLHCPDCVEKLESAKIARKIWNIFPPIRASGNHVRKSGFWREDILPICPPRSARRVFQQHRLAAGACLIPALTAPRTQQAFGQTRRTRWPKLVNTDHNDARSRDFAQRPLISNTAPDRPTVWSNSDRHAPTRRAERPQSVQGRSSKGSDEHQRNTLSDGPPTGYRELV